MKWKFFIKLPIFCLLITAICGCEKQIKTSGGTILYNPSNQQQNIEQPKDQKNNSNSNDTSTSTLSNEEGVVTISEVKKNRWQYDREIDLPDSIKNSYISNNNNNSIKKKNVIDLTSSNVNKTDNNQIISQENINNNITANSSITKGLYIQVGVYKKYANAQRVIKSIKNSGITNINITEENGAHKILIGPYQNKQNTDTIIEKLEEIGIFDYFFIRK